MNVTLLIIGIIFLAIGIWFLIGLKKSSKSRSVIPPLWMFGFATVIGGNALLCMGIPSTQDMGIFILLISFILGGFSVIGSLPYRDSRDWL